MLWVVHCLDGPDAARLRPAARAEHSARLRSGLVDPVLYGMLTDDAGEPVGSLIVLRAPDRETVRRYVDEDPFTVTGVWRHTTVTAFVESTNSPARIEERETR